MSVCVCVCLSNDNGRNSYPIFLKFWDKGALVHEINEFEAQIRTLNISQMAAKNGVQKRFLAHNFWTVHQIKSRPITKKVQN